MNGKEPWEDGLRELPREIEPARDLWPEIERRIAGSPWSAGAGAAGEIGRARRTWPVELVAAAAAIIVFVAGWGVARLSAPGGGEAGTTPVVAGDALPDADAEYEAAAKQLLETLEQGGVAPETATQLRRDLAVLDQAVQGIRSAMDERPSDARLERQLTAEVRRRNRVLQQIASIQVAGLHLGGNE